MRELVLLLLLFFAFLTVFGQKQFSYEPIFNTLKPKTGNVALLLGFYHEGRCESMYIGIQNGAVSIKKFPYIVVP